MSEECADLVGGTRGKDVFELAGLLLNLGLAVQRQTVGKKALRQPMAADDVSGALSPPERQFNDHAAIANRDSGRLERVMTRIYENSVVVRLGRVWTSCKETKVGHLFDRDADRQSPVNLHMLDLGDLTVFFERP